MTDPIKHCDLYKDEGCAHVDGLLCNVETCKERMEHMKEYSEEYDAYYDPLTGVWLEDKCKYENCEYCVGRPEKFIEKMSGDD